MDHWKFDMYFNRMAKVCLFKKKNLGFNVNNKRF